jgi:hypothetical protein
MSLTFPEFKEIKDINDWCQHLYRELSYPFTVYAGDQTVWDDLRVSLSSARVPAASFPNYAKTHDDGEGSPSVGVYAYHFDDGEYIFFSVQMPHAWKEGSTIYPHIHFMCTTDVSPADNFGIGLEYLWTDIDDDAAATTSAVEIDISTGVNSQWQHQIANLSATGIAGTGKGLSSILQCRLYRQAAVADNYADQVVITDFDIHYEKDTHGSRGIVTK